MKAALSLTWGDPASTFRNETAPGPKPPVTIIMNGKNSPPNAVACWPYRAFLTLAGASNTETGVVTLEMLDAASGSTMATSAVLISSPR